MKSITLKRCINEIKLKCNIVNSNLCNSNCIVDLRYYVCVKWIETMQRRDCPNKNEKENTLEKCFKSNIGRCCF